jgi:tetratricopeptide (TPR) repeat protein
MRQGYEIHSLVHLAMQTYLGFGEIDSTLAKASTVLADVLPDFKYENWAAWRVYLPHKMSLLANVAEDPEASADVCMKAGNYLDEVAWSSESLILFKRAKKLYVALFGEENAKTIGAMYSIGYSFHACGRLKEAQEIQEKVLEVRKRTLGEEHPYTLVAMLNLAITYKRLGGRLEEVQELEEKVVEVRKHTLREEHPDTLSILHNLANTYRDLGGRMKEVQELQEKVVEVRKRTLGEEKEGGFILSNEGISREIKFDSKRRNSWRRTPRYFEYHAKSCDHI